MTSDFILCLIFTHRPMNDGQISLAKRLKAEASVGGMSLKKVSYETFVFSVFSRNQEIKKSLTGQ